MAARVYPLGTANGRCECPVVHRARTALEVRISVTRYELEAFPRGLRMH
jgi:hypothetical protein